MRITEERIIRGLKRIDRNIALRMAKIESNYVTTAKRYEPAFRKRYIDKLGLNEQETTFRSTSHGLFQIMGENLRAMGFNGVESEYDSNIDLQIHYYEKWFTGLLVRYKGDVLRAVSAYNHGTSRDNPYEDIYVQKFLNQKGFTYSKIMGAIVLTYITYKMIKGLI